MVLIRKTLKNVYKKNDSIETKITVEEKDNYIEIHLYEYIGNHYYNKLSCENYNIDEIINMINNNDFSYYENSLMIGGIGGFTLNYVECWVDIDNEIFELKSNLQLLLKTEKLFLNNK